MLQDLFRGVDVSLQRALRNAIVRSPIRAILIQQWQQCRCRGLISPGGHACAQRPQRAGPRVDRVPGGIATATSAPLSLQPRPGTVPGKAQHSRQRQLIYFDQFALVAVCPESAHPIEIKLDRAPRQMASSPKIDDRTFAVITKSHIHTFLDGPTLAELSRQHDVKTSY